MRTKQVLLIALSIFWGHRLLAQSPQKNYYGAWTFHEKNATINGISAGFWSTINDNRRVNTNGLRIEAIGLGVLSPLIPRSPVAGSQEDFDRIRARPISERVNGINLSGSGTICDCRFNGITAGFIGQINDQVNGFSAALVMNISQVHNGLMVSYFNDTFRMNGVQLGLGNHGYMSKGLQVGALGNDATMMHGIQIGGLSNFAETMRGIQIAGYNGSDQVKGIQIGIFNYAKQLKGLQIGLWNVNEKRKLPLINWSI